MVIAQKKLEQDVAATMRTMPIEGQLVVSIVKSENNSVEMMAVYDKNHGDVRNIMRQNAKIKNTSVEDINEFVRKNTGSNGLAYAQFPNKNTKKVRPYHLFRDSCFPFLPNKAMNAYAENSHFLIS